MFTIAESLKATQELLRSGVTLAEFEALHGIRGKTDGKHLQLDYDQISCKHAEPFTRVCRGLILDATTFDVIAMGLGKFWNATEHYAAPIDWDSAAVFEKIDGSMVLRWWSPHTERFETTTRFQLPGNVAVNTVGTAGITWRQLIDRCLATVPELAEQPRNEAWTLEVCSPENQIVVRHFAFTAKLLAIRNMETLVEKDIREHPRAPKSYRFTSAAEVAEFANKHPATELEGFVVVDAAFNRVKMKSDQYVQLHRAKDGLKGINNIILLARGNDYEEICVHFPEYRADLDTVAQIIQSVIATHEVAYEAHKDIAIQKEFALTILPLKLDFPGALFAVRAKQVATIAQAFHAMPESTFCKLFKSRVREALGDKYKEVEDAPA